MGPSKTGESSQPDPTNHPFSLLCCPPFRVLRVHEKWVQVRMSLQQRLMQPLSARIKDFTEKETNVTKSTKTVIELRPIETNQHFRFLQECMDWVNSQLVRASLG